MDDKISIGVASPGQRTYPFSYSLKADLPGTFNFDAEHKTMAHPDVDIIGIVDYKIELTNLNGQPLALTGLTIVNPIKQQCVESKSYKKTEIETSTKPGGCCESDVTNKIQWEANVVNYGVHKFLKIGDTVEMVVDVKNNLNYDIKIGGKISQHVSSKATQFSSKYVYVKRLSLTAKKSSIKEKKKRESGLVCHGRKNSKMY
jgi:hypothetical protein